MIYFGRPGGPAEVHSQYFRSREGEDNIFIACPNAIGDVNGDGFGDLLWGCNLTAPDTERGAPRRAAEVLYGSPMGLVRADPPHRLISEGGWLELGFNTTSIGDSNRDGYADFAIPAALAYVPTGSEGRERVRPQVYLGGPMGPSTQPSALLERPNTMSLAWGISLDGNFGDFNGDGSLDVLAGEASFDRNWRFRVHLYLGAERGLSTRSAATLDGTTGGLAELRRYERRQGPCDLNGDGLADIVRPTYDERSSLVAIFLGTPKVVSAIQPDIQARPEVLLEDRRTSGMGVICAPDLNGDGFSDIFATTLSRIPVFAFAGAANLGSATWVEVTTLPLDSAGTPYSLWDYSAGGDVDGDGLTDLVVTHLGGDTWVVRGSRTTMLSGSIRLRPPIGLRYEGGIAF